MQRRLILQAAATLAGGPLTAAAQDKPVTVVVGYSAGSAPDIAARYVTAHLSAALGGRHVIVDNRPGAGGQLAFVALKQARPDGNALAFVPSNLLTIFPSTYAKLPYDAKDVVPIVTACTFDFALAVAHDHPAKTLGEFIAWCKAHPKQASVGNPGLGTPQHFFTWTFGRAAGVAFEPVPYRSTPQMAQEIAGGQLTSAIAATPVFVELARAGRIRMLATTGQVRNALFPQVPTFAEAGFPTLRSVEWFGFFGRAGTPQEVLDRFASAVRQIVTRDDVRGQLEAMGFTAAAHDAAWLNDTILRDFERWADVVRQTGFKADN